MIEDKGNFLSGVRVLDFTGELGPYAGKLYAGLGADVIHLEPITGDPLRDIGPFYKGIPGQERSLQFLYYNGGKRGVVLDIKQEKGKEIFIELCKTADLLLESFVPGYLDELGLSYERLSAVNPKLVHTSITPFGHFGEYSDVLESDLVCSAMGGFLFLAGTENDKPNRLPDNQAYRMAEGYAAVGSSIALYFAHKTGIGQFIDVSCVEAVGMALENSPQYWDLEGKNRRGIGKEAGATICPCKDGYVVMGAIMGKNKFMWDIFLQWMKDENVQEWEALDNDKWIDPDYRKTKEAMEIYSRVVNRFTMKHDKSYLYENGQAHKVPVTPLSNGKDILENPQLEHCDFWETVKHEHLDGEIVCPGAPYELGELQWRFGNPAPTFGQHTAEILAELGYATDTIEELAKEGTVYAG